MKLMGQGMPSGQPDKSGGAWALQRRSPKTDWFIQKVLTTEPHLSP